MPFLLHYSVDRYIEAAEVGRFEEEDEGAGAQCQELEMRRSTLFGNCAVGLLSEGASSSF